MYKIIQYYKDNGQVCNHLFGFERSYRNAYEELLEMQRIFEDSLIIVQGLSREDIEFLMNNRLSEEKVVMTIIEEEGL